MSDNVEKPKRDAREVLERLKNDIAKDPETLEMVSDAFFSEAGVKLETGEIVSGLSELREALKVKDSLPVYCSPVFPEPEQIRRISSVFGRVSRIINATTPGIHCSKSSVFDDGVLVFLEKKRGVDAGKITAINYDKASFPLSPYVESYAAYEESDAIVFEAQVVSALMKDFNEFCVSFPEEYQADLPSLPEGNYTMQVSVQGSAESPVIAFDFQNNSTGEVHEGVRMEQMKYINDFDQATMSMTFSEKGEFEMPWSMKYLENVFGEHIVGSSEFWTQFAGGLDVVSTPIILRMERAQQGLPEKPIVADLSKANLLIES